MSDILVIAERIEQKIKLLENMRKEIRERAEKKAVTMAEYDKVLAVTIIKLKNNVELEFEGLKIEHPQATVMEKIAKGICWKERLEAEKADALFKSLTSNIASVMAELTGYECINKYLDKT